MNSTLSILDLEGALGMKYVSTLCLTLGQNIQFGIMVFLEVQEINLQDNM